MSLSVKVNSITDTENGFVVEFKGYRDGEIFLENALHFSRFSTAQEVLEVCMEEVRAAAEPLPDPPDLSLLLNQQHMIDPDMAHPLYGVTDPVQAKNLVERLIAARLEHLVSEMGLVDRYPGVERDTWERQIEEALNYKQGQGSSFITGMANTQAEETPEEFADSILDNSSQFMTSVAPILKAKHELVCTLDALPDDTQSIRAFFDNQVLNWSV